MTLSSATPAAAMKSALRDDTLVGLQQGAFRPDLELDRQASKGRIRCPHCTWQPHRTSRWHCMPAGHPEHFAGGCGHTWQTFDTRGRCPGCSYQWRNTSCLRCGAWSRHEDWYERAGEGTGGAPGR